MQVGRLVVADRPLAGRAPPADFDGCAARLVPRRLGALAVSRAPIREESQRSGQLVPGGGELVHVALGSLGVGLGEHEALALEAAKALAQDVGGDPAKRVLQIAETTRTAEKGLDEEERPAVADAVERGRERRGQRLARSGRFARLSGRVPARRGRVPARKRRVAARAGRFALTGRAHPRKPTSHVWYGTHLQFASN
jgi:hypothetical protein